MEYLFNGILLDHKKEVLILQMGKFVWRHFIPYPKSHDCQGAELGLDTGLPLTWMLLTSQFL